MALLGERSEENRGLSGKDKNSLIAAGMTIEGKIEGAGHIEMEGRFKGEITVDGDLTIAEGAEVTGNIKADKVIVKGKANGNIEVTSRVDLLDTAVIEADIKAPILTVAERSRMRGKLDCG